MFRYKFLNKWYAVEVSLGSISYLQMADHWETAPRHMIRLDIRSLLQDAAIEEVRFA